MNREKAKQVRRAMKALILKDPSFSINELRVIVALERLIARLSLNRELAEHLIFKGGFVLLKSYEGRRFTRDADALAVDISKQKLKDLVCDALTVNLDDGLWYGDVQVEELTEQGTYGAYRFDCAFHIGEADIKKVPNFARVHLDVGFSDKLPLRPASQVMPSVLKHEEPVTWKIYPMEYIVAEKVQTLFDRGSANSRAKDIHDLAYLFPRCRNQDGLFAAIEKTFENRGTALPASWVVQAGRFDKTILQAAWPGVPPLGKKPAFETAWNELMGHLRYLDESLKF